MKVICCLCLLGVPLMLISQVKIGAELHTSIRTKINESSYVDRFDLGLTGVAFFGKHKLALGPLMTSETRFQLNANHNFNVSGFQTGYAYSLGSNKMIKLNLSATLFYNYNKKASAEVYAVKSAEDPTVSSMIQRMNGFQHQMNFYAGVSPQFNFGKHLYTTLHLQFGRSMEWSKLSDPQKLCEQEFVTAINLSTALQVQIGYQF